MLSQARPFPVTRLRVRPLAILACLGLLLAGCTTAVPSAAVFSAPAATSGAANPLHFEDADRFARLLDAHPTPSAAQLQADYIAPGSAGLKIFTPYRIINADNLAAKVAANPATYRKALDLCLPVARGMSVDAAATLAQVQGLLKQSEPATVYMLFGGNNSGGTAGQDGLVLGLEVLCRKVSTEAEARAILTEFIAHEVTHVYQDRVKRPGGPLHLLAVALNEGFADFVAELATGNRAGSDHERARYGLAHEAELWRRFQADMADESRLRHWFYNNSEAYQKELNGAPPDLGYWLGKRICEAYYARASDKAAALQVLLERRDPQQILKDSGYAPSL